MHRVGVHEDEVVLAPVVALVVVDLVAAPLQDVEGRLVLVAVAMVRRLWRQLDEVDLDRLGEKVRVAWADPPPRPALRAVARMRHRRVVDYHAVVAYPVHRQLTATVLTEPVGLRRQRPYENPSVLAHSSSDSRCCNQIGSARPREMV